MNCTAGHGLAGEAGFILFIAWFAVVGLANVYMRLFGRLRVDIKAERLEIASKEKSLDGTPPSSPRE